MGDMAKNQGVFGTELARMFVPALLWAITMQNGSTISGMDEEGTKDKKRLDLSLKQLKQTTQAILPPFSVVITLTSLIIFNSQIRRWGQMPKLPIFHDVFRIPTLACPKVDFDAQNRLFAPTLHIFSSTPSSVDYYSNMILKIRGFLGSGQRRAILHAWT